MSFAAKNGNGGTCNDNELLLEVVRRSNAVCLQLYEKEGVGVSSSTAVASIFGRLYNNSSSAMRGEVGSVLLFDALCDSHHSRHAYHWYLYLPMSLYNSLREVMPLLYRRMPFCGGWSRDLLNGGMHW